MINKYQIQIQAVKVILSGLILLSFFLISGEFSAEAANGGDTWGPFQCARHGFGNDTWCVTSFAQDPGNKQVWRYDLWADAHGHGSTSDFEVHACISRWGDNYDCIARLWYDYPWEDGTWRYYDSWSGNQFGDWQTDFNMIIVTSYVRDGESRVWITDGERAVSNYNLWCLNNCSPRVGENFTISWDNEWAMGGTQLLWGGAIGSGNDGVGEDGSRDFTCSGIGWTQFRTIATGPGGNGPISESRTLDIECQPPPPPPIVCGDGIIDAGAGEVCDSNNFGGQTCANYGFSAGSLKCINNCTAIDSSGCGRFKCIAPGPDTCGFVAGDGGPNQCAPTNDPVCLPPPVPSVDLDANNSDGPITISYNTSAVLSWTSANATSCTASIGWSGGKSLSGSESTGNLTSLQTYTLSCSGSGGSASDGVTVNVSSPPAPDVDLDWNGSDGTVLVVYNSTGALSWVIQGLADRCEASSTAGDFSGSKSIPTGSETKGPITSSRTYTLTCSGPGGTHSDQVILNVSVPNPNDPSNVTVTQPNYCLSGPAATTNWTYSDPSGSPQLAYQVQIDDQGSFNTPEWDSFKVFCEGCRSNSTPQGYLVFNKTYKARVRVWNQFDLASGWTESGSFKTPKHAYPQVDFTYTPLNPIPNDSIQFTDQTTFYDGNPNGRRWAWLFGDGGSSTQQNPQHTYTQPNTYNATLTATDNANQSCSITKPVNVKVLNPIWKEVNPGG